MYAYTGRGEYTPNYAEHKPVSSPSPLFHKIYRVVLTSHQGRIMYPTIDGSLRWNERLAFKIELPSADLMDPTLYQVAVEFFNIKHEQKVAGAGVYNHQISVVCNELGANDSYDVFNKNRVNTLLSFTLGTGETGYNAVITKDTIGLPIGTLSTFVNQDFVVQLVDAVLRTPFSETVFGASGGDWTMGLIFYPIM